MRNSSARSSLTVYLNLILSIFFILASMASSPKKTAC